MSGLRNYLVAPGVVARLCTHCWLSPVAQIDVDELVEVEGDLPETESGNVVLSHEQYKRLAGSHDRKVQS